MKKTIYEIREYNKKTREYTEVVDSVTATTAEEAKEIYIKQKKWKPKKNIILFVRLPNCK
jgi:hypothetical protein